MEIMCTWWKVHFCATQHWVYKWGVRLINFLVELIRDSVPISSFSCNNNQLQSNLFRQLETLASKNET